MQENDLKAVAEIPKNLKGVYARLQEIAEILASPERSLDTLVNGDSPKTEDLLKESGANGSAPSIEKLVLIVDSIDRSAHTISKLTNRLVGN